MGIVSAAYADPSASYEGYYALSASFIPQRRIKIRPGNVGKRWLAGRGLANSFLFSETSSFCMRCRHGFTWTVFVRNRNIIEAPAGTAGDDYFRRSLTVSEVSGLRRQGLSGECSL